MQGYTSVKTTKKNGGGYKTMGIRVGRFWLVYESVTMEAINPIYIGISEEDIRDYMKTHPMPEDSEYSPEDLIRDVTNTSGFLSLSDEMKPETREYTVELIGALL